MRMDDYSDSIDRRPKEYVLFALAFIGFVIALSGIIVSSPLTAVVGGIMLLVGVSCFRSSSAN